jgi:hypothetical protein
MKPEKYTLVGVLQHCSRTKTLVQVIRRGHTKDEPAVDHSYLVSFIAMTLYVKLMAHSSFSITLKRKFKGLGIAPMTYILIKVLLHDTPEDAISGIPLDTKRVLKETIPGFAGALDDLKKTVSQAALIRSMLGSMDNVLSKIVELAYIIDVFVHANTECEFGNLAMSVVSDDARARIESMGDYFPEGFISSLFTSKEWGL